MPANDFTLTLPCLSITSIFIPVNPCLKFLTSLDNYSKETHACQPFHLFCIIKSMTTLAQKILNEAITQTKEAKDIWPETLINRKTGKRFTYPSEDVEDLMNLDTPRHLLITGPEGSGKSALGAFWALGKLKWGCDMVIVAPNMPSLRRSTWPEFANWVPWNCVIHEHQHMQNPAFSPYKSFELVFRNALGGFSKAIVSGIGDHHAIFLEGININSCWLDEARSISSSEPYTILAGRIRIIGPKKQKPQILITTTPTRKNHWLYSFFGSIKKSDPYKEFKENSKHLSLEMNPEITGVDKEYATQRGLVLTEDEYAMKVEGKWGDESFGEGFLDNEIMWDSLYDPELGQVRKKNTPESDWSDILVLGIDAAVTRDTFAIVGVTRHPKNKEAVAVRVCKIWRPDSGKIDFRGTPENPGPELFIRSLCKQYNVITAVYDLTQMEDLASRLTQDGILWMQEFSQMRKREISDQKLYDLILQKRLYHRNQTELREHVLQAGVKLDAMGSKRRLIKVYPSQKIDAVVALSMASYEVLRLNV